MSGFSATASRPWRMWHGGMPAVIAAGLLASCAGAAPQRPGAEYLDEATGTTITRVAEPLVLYSDDAALAVNARDYIYAAPLAVNQSGQHTRWLWLGLWSTIDRGPPAGIMQPGDFARIVLIVDGEPMELDAGARVSAIPGLGRLPYVVPVATARNFFLPLTGSQIARIGRAGTVTLRTEMTGGGSRIWQPWTDIGGQLKDFGEVAAAQSPTVPVTPATHE